MGSIFWHSLQITTLNSSFYQPLLFKTKIPFSILTINDVFYGNYRMVKAEKQLKPEMYGRHNKPMNG